MGDVPGFGESRARVLQMCLNPLEQNNDIITSGVTEQTAHKVTWENTEGVWAEKKEARLVCGRTFHQKLFVESHKDWRWHWQVFLSLGLSRNLSVGGRSSSELAGPLEAT